MAITLVDNQLEEVVRILPKGLQAIRDSTVEIVL